MLLVAHGIENFTWDIKEGFNSLPPAGTVNVSSLRADGEELTLIVSLFTHGHLTIPLAHTPVNSWYGDTARSIFDALARHMT